MARVRVTTWAKVNLTLEVLGRRPDGFHEVRTVMQSVSLSDDLLLEHASGLALDTDDSALLGDDNLVLRAARLLADSAGKQLGARIGLEKGIPVAAGLGGASADGAAALIGLEKLWDLSISSAERLSLGASLGSDVPFFLQGGTALAMGRGESVQPLPDVSPFWLVLLVLPHGLKTKTAEMYRRLPPEAWTSGERSLALAEEISRGAAISDQMLGNCFEPVAERAFPALAGYRQALLGAGANRAHLSGAGPALFSIFSEQRNAEAAAARLSGDGHRPLVARSMRSAEARPAPMIEKAG